MKEIIIVLCLLVILVCAFYLVFQVFHTHKNFKKQVEIEKSINAAYGLYDLTGYYRTDTDSIHRLTDKAFKVKESEETIMKLKAFLKSVNPGVLVNIHPVGGYSYKFCSAGRMLAEKEYLDRVTIPQETIIRRSSDSYGTLYLDVTLKGE